MDWVKVMCNLLDHRKIKMIRKGPEGHTLVLLWLLLLAEAGKSNRGGYLMISDSLPYTPETLGMVTDMPLPTVQLGLHTFSKLDMIDQEDGVVFIKNWSKYQSEDKLEARRESDRVRKQRQRENERQRLLIWHVAPQPDFPPEMSRDTAGVTSRDMVDVTSRDVTSENREDQRQDETTVQHLRLLLSGTPLNNVLDSDLIAFGRAYGTALLEQAADIAAETLRRSRDKIANPSGYLRSFCMSLTIPSWYIPYEVRRAAVLDRKQRKIAERVEEEESCRKERAETAARNSFWESLSEQDRNNYVSAARSEYPLTHGSSLTTTFVETAKFLAWEEALLSRTDRAGGADVTLHSEG